MGFFPASHFTHPPCFFFTYIKTKHIKKLIEQLIVDQKFSQSIIAIILFLNAIKNYCAINFCLLIATIILTINWIIGAYLCQEAASQLIAQINCCLIARNRVKIINCAINCSLIARSRVKIINCAINWRFISKLIIFSDNQLLQLIYNCGAINL